MTVKSVFTGLINLCQHKFAFIHSELVFSETTLFLGCDPLSRVLIQSVVWVCTAKGVRL